MCVDIIIACSIIIMLPCLISCTCISLLCVCVCVCVQSEVRRMYKALCEDNEDFAGFDTAKG